MTTPALAKDVRGKGRHYVHPATGDLVPSVTNILSVINKPALPRWAAKVVAEQAAAMKSSLRNLEDDEIVDLLKGAPWRSSTRAANRGTTIHGYLEARMLGVKPDEISGEAARFRRAADKWLNEWKPEPVAVERTVFAPDYAGTGDLWCVIKGRTWLIDYKTSKAIYAEGALQLAALNACTLAAQVADDVVTTVPNEPAERCGVLRIGEDGWELAEVRDWREQAGTFRACLELWHWQQAKDHYATEWESNNE